MKQDRAQDQKQPDPVRAPNEPYNPRWERFAALARQQLDQDLTELLKEMEPERIPLPIMLPWWLRFHPPEAPAADELHAGMTDYAPCPPPGPVQAPAGAGKTTVWLWLEDTAKEPALR